MYRLQFLKDGEEILNLEIDSTPGSLPRFVSGDDSWFDYARPLYSKSLNREIQASESPRDWTYAVADFYKDADELTVRVLETSASGESSPTAPPPIPRESLDSENQRNSDKHYYIKEGLDKISAPASNDPETVRFEGMALSGWWRRVGAYVLDSIFITIAWAILFIIIGIAIGLNTSGSAEISDGAVAGILIIGFLVGFAITIGYYLMTMTRQGINNGQTWGLQILNIAVVRQDGKRVDAGFILLRQLVVIGVLFGIVNYFTFSLGFIVDSLWPLWDDKKQTLHDKIVKSVMVRSDVR